MPILSRNNYDALHNSLMFQLKYKRQGRIMVFTGNPMTQMGNGKTTSAVATALLMDKVGWDVSKIEYRFEPFINLIDQMRYDALVNKKYYQVAINDESQRAIPNDEWLSANAKNMLYVNSVFRKARCLTIYISPSFNFILKKIRHLVNYWVIPDTEIIESGQIMCKMKVFALGHDLFKEKMNLYPLKVYSEAEKCMFQADEFIVKKPPEEILDAVEKKEDFEKGLIHQDAILASRKADVISDQKPKLSLQELITKFDALPETTLEFNKKKKVSQGLIQYLDMNLNREDARHIASVLTIKKQVEREKEVEKNG